MPLQYGPQQPRSTTPDEFSTPVTPQQYAGHSDHSFTLQAIMELQKTTGQMTSAVQSLKDSIDKQDVKVTKLEETISGVTHKIYAATAVLTILVAIGGFVVSKSWDLMALNVSAASQVQSSENIDKKTE